MRSMLPFVVAHELLKNPQLTFLQIGAFDGEGDDDLRELIVTASACAACWWSRSRPRSPGCSRRIAISRK